MLYHEAFFQDMPLSRKLWIYYILTGFQTDASLIGRLFEIQNFCQRP